MTARFHLKAFADATATAAERYQRAAAELTRAIPSVRVVTELERLQRVVTGRYRVDGVLGRGGMGAVYLAWEYALERPVAIKVLSLDESTTVEDRERFRREARTTANLSHANVVPLHAFGEGDGLMYFVMSYVRGESLAERIRREGRLDADEAGRILAELADALDYAHRHGIVHRDVKPENILIEADTGRPMIADFGVAVVSTSEHSRAEVGKKFGTPHFMSPEQALGEHELDGRSDLYALGVLGYVMLTGRPPFDGSSFVDLAAQHVAKSPPPLRGFLGARGRLVAAAVMRCLAKHRADRWSSGTALNRYLTTRGVRARIAWRPRTRLRAALAYLTLGLTALVRY